MAAVVNRQHQVIHVFHSGTSGQHWRTVLKPIRQAQREMVVDIRFYIYCFSNTATLYLIGVAVVFLTIQRYSPIFSHAILICTTELVIKTGMYCQRHAQKKEHNWF